MLHVLGINNENENTEKFEECQDNLLVHVLMNDECDE